MPIAIPTITAALQAIGNAHIYVGDPFTANGMLALGAKDGDIEVSFGETYSDLTAEQTGEMVHNSLVMGESLTVTVPIVLDDTVWAKISPTGTKGGGFSIPQRPVVTSVLIAPNDEVGGGLTRDATQWTRVAGNGVTGAVGAGAVPRNCIWIWRARVSKGAVSLSYSNGGKSVVPVTFTGMFDAARPEGHKLYTIGDPRAVTPTPIAVLI